jgi:WD40 repeat protein
VNELVSAPDLSLPMAQPALVPLLDGRVLVIGDDGDGGGTGTRALVYDPATGVSESTGPLVSGESLAIVDAVRLRDGRVLVIGETLAQIFDPDTLRFAPVGPLVTPRSMAGVAALPDGRVLVAGGYPSGLGVYGTADAMSSAELFDPKTLTFSPTGSMSTSRSMLSMAVLPDGRVFVSPGESRMTVETYDPSTGTFSAAGTMSSYGYGDAIALPDGRVVVLGGMSLSNRGFAAVWDPASLTFSPQRNPPGQVRSATLLDDGRILLLGDRSLGSRSSVYDPTTGETTSIRPFTKAWWPKATRLSDGRVLIVGGLTDGDIRPEGGGTQAPGVSTVEIFQ